MFRITDMAYIAFFETRPGQMLMTHLPETRAGIQRRKLALDSSASFWRELQQNLR